MSMFGAKILESKVEQAGDLQSNLDMMRLIVLNQINTLKSMHAGLQDTVREVAMCHGVLQNEIGSISDNIYLTIYSESKGALTWGERFSSRNGGREDTGYVTMFLVRILGMGLSSARKAGGVTVALPVNIVEIPNCKVSLTNDRPRKHDNFDIPFEETEWSVINFVSKTNSSDTLCTTVCL